MPRDAAAFLNDIIKAAQHIQAFTAGRTFADYSTNDLVHSAVEREFIVIGEALSRLEKLDANLAARIADYRQIIGFRNVLVHGYESIDDQIVWLVVQNNVPILQSQAESLLSDRSTDNA